MKNLHLDIFVDDRFYGTMRMKNLWGGVFPLTEEEIRNEVERRLPSLKGKKYTVVL